VPAESRRAARPPRRPHPIFDVAVLLLLALWEPFAASASVLSYSYGHPWHEGALHLIAAGHFATAIVIFLWLVHLVVTRAHARQSDQPRFVRFAVPWVAVFTGLAATADGAVDRPWAQVTNLAYDAALAWLTIEVIGRHNLSLHQIQRFPSTVRRQGIRASTAEAISIAGLTIIACYWGSGLWSLSGGWKRRRRHSRCRDQRPHPRNRHHMGPDLRRAVKPGH
jgi:hypothetical protein